MVSSPMKGLQTGQPIGQKGGLSEGAAAASHTDIQQSFQPIPAERCTLESLPTTPLFGTDGIRGQAGTLLTAPLATQVGFWAGQVLRCHGEVGPVIVGQDSRTSSDMLASGLAAGLTTAGLEVWNMGLCPTAAVAHLALGNAGGIMISASHNPPADNGIKFFGSDGTKLSGNIQKQIEAALRGQGLPDVSACKLLSEAESEAVIPNSQIPKWGRTYQRPDLVERYMDFFA